MLLIFKNDKRNTNGNISIHEDIRFILDYCFNYNNDWPHYDFSHQGPNFPVWHRVLLLWFERELQKIAEDDSFTLPYWDWLNQGRNCAVCTNDLMGESDLGGTVGVMDSSSPFSQWLTVCKAPEEKSICRHCNFSMEGEPLVRFMKPMGHFPDTEQYEFTFNFTHYDEYPYNKISRGGFRIALEGFLNKNGFGATMHNEVILHIFTKEWHQNRKRKTKIAQYRIIHVT